MHEQDARLRSRYRERLLTAPRRALVTSSGRVIASDPSGWMPAERVELPPYGGELVLPSGVAAFAEPLDHDGTLLVRRIEPASAGGSRGGAVQVRVLGERPRVVVDGRSIALGRRQAEILALLCLRPDGLTTEQLCTELYGGHASPSTVRGEVSRLRKHLGVGIETDPYRLAGHVESDVGRVPRCCSAARPGRGRALRRAAAPAVGRPGVEGERDSLEGWMRHAVMSGDDRDTLWEWLQTPSGRDDPAGWKHVLSALDFRDPRRSQAAAEIGRLRAAAAAPA